MLPLEVIVQSSRVALHYDIPIDEYTEAMMVELQDFEEKELWLIAILLPKKEEWRESTI